ncbi:MAG: hypothetical protein A3E21_00630 [Sulfurimonas sp. RIFCSPHIGHO2_12_FULL_36_9]|uniref:hypothetical protein n=1 Tax=Sulfurimonas sp. RIFCSPLOWO2_12_36_12 TaxID=1802253 RepID=UPI0008B028AA|nr:hypothetical protein [Sulfurimonas sp. RIFCSPLOWO2_12_36_12]OHD97292.1 MAG: hypothetical protein A3J26_03200 [Sulfurimonas sp. RIFCSPLOWO2_02_FULL_36_28]OHD99289.1 MAG: hypothetical protein A3E21_00630 [Sulfurimonas sp. RIFCSPHIGHO2_12_FULL_36_9]OHE01233.1 MAG: hypothetical protein A3K14_08425 [Sulfurimonas sp. RIFCSPLOWO2_12_FULL_36_74]OHE01502.1 MAG: hypothetical protein A2W82_02635 [Sulfurimonas sp. RIFCSPLOWO2_12_36_12]
MKFLPAILITILPLLLSAANMQTRELPINNMIEQNKEIAKLAAIELSKSLPQTIDKYTELTEIKADDTTLIYIYEINSAPKSDEVVKKEDRSRMQKAITKGVCSSSKRFLDANVSIRYIYKSFHTKAELFRFDIKSDSCGKL